jgi:hypothetical protein
MQMWNMGRSCHYFNSKEEEADQAWSAHKDGYDDPDAAYYYWEEERQIKKDTETEIEDFLNRDEDEYRLMTPAGS